VHAKTVVFRALLSVFQKWSPKRPKPVPFSEARGATRDGAVLQRSCNEKRHDGLHF
jgi:hypothetical protein